MSYRSKCKKQFKLRRRAKDKTTAVLIFGGNGAGKSALMAAMIADLMTDRIAMSAALKKANAQKDKWKSGGYKKLTNQEKHLVYSTFRVEKNKLVSKDIDVSRIGLFDPVNNPNPMFFPYGSFLFIDEAQEALDSSNGGTVKHKSAWAGIRRHGGYSLYMACPRAKRVDLDFRGVAKKIIEVLDMDEKCDKYGRVIETVWTGYEFDNCYQVDNYLKDGKNDTSTARGKKFTYVYKGDVRDIYDYEEYETAFYTGCENRDYDSAESPKKQFSVAAAKDFIQKKFNHSEVKK